MGPKPRSQRGQHDWSKGNTCHTNHKHLFNLAVASWARKSACLAERQTLFVNVSQFYITVGYLRVVWDAFPGRLEKNLHAVAVHGRREMRTNMGVLCLDALSRVLCPVQEHCTAFSKCRTTVACQELQVCSWFACACLRPWIPFPKPPMCSYSTKLITNYCSTVATHMPYDIWYMIFGNSRRITYA